MGKRITRRRKSKIYSSKNGISSVNSAKMFKSCLSAPVFASECQVSATHDCSAVGQRILRRKRCFKTNLGGNDTAFKNSLNVQDIYVSVRSSDNDSGMVDDKSEVNSRKNKFETKLDLNEMSIENVLKVPATYESVKSVEISTKLKHDNKENVASYAITQPTISRSIKMEVPRNGCITKHDQTFSKNDKYSMYRRKIRERKCKTCISLNDVGFKNSAKISVASQSVQSFNSNSAKDINYNHTQNMDKDGKKQLFILIKDIKVEMPEYNSIIEHYQSIKTNENSAIVKRTSRDRKCKTNPNKKDITADKSASMPNLLPNKQVSDSQMIVPADNSAIVSRQIRERKVKANFSQNDLSTENSSKMPNTSPPIQLYESFGQNIATIDNSKMRRRKNRERKSKTSRKLNGSSSRTQDECPTARYFERSSKRFSRYNNTHNTAPDIKKGLITPVKRSKMEMSECNYFTERCQSIATDDIYEMNRRKSKERKCKTKLNMRERLSENTAKMLCSCPPLSFDNDCRNNAARDDLTMDRQKRSEQTFKAGQSVNNRNSSEPPDICPATLGRDSRRRFLHSNTQNVALNATKQLIILVKDIKMEIPENKFVTQHCQNLATKGNYAVDKHKSGERDISSENASTMQEYCSSFQCLDNDCQILTTNSTSAIDILNSRGQKYKDNQIHNDKLSENSSRLPDICSGTFDSHSLIPVSDIKLEMPENNYFIKRCKNIIINENNGEDKNVSETEDEYSSTQAKDFSSAADINNSLKKDSSIMHEEREFSLENHKSFDFMTEKYLPINDDLIPSLKNTDCSEYIEAVETSIANDSKKFSYLNDEGNAFVDKTSFDNFKKREISLENCRTSEYDKDESGPVIQGMTNNDECKINTKHDTETQTLVTCNMSMKQNSEIEFKIKVTRKIKSSGDHCSNKRLNIGNEQYQENNIESKNFFLNAKPQSVSSMQSSPNECVECNVSTPATDTISILSGKDACCVTMDETSVLNNKKRGASEIKNNSRGIMDKNLKEKTNNDETKLIPADNVLNMTLKRGVEVGRNSEVERKSIKNENEITEIKEKSDDILINSKIDNFNLLQCYSSECTEKNENVDPSQIHNVPSSSLTSDCYLIVDEASVFDNVNTESGGDKNDFENAMDKNIHVKGEISYGDRATSIGSDDLPNTPPKGGVKREFCNNRKEAKSYIGNTNKSTVNEIQNTKVGSILLLQNLSSEFSSVASSSGTRSCSLIMDETSVSNNKERESSENKNNFQSIMDKNLKEITNKDETKPLAAENVLNMFLKRGLEVGGNGEIAKKRKKIENEINEKSDDILINPKIDNFHLLQRYPIECTEKNRNPGSSQIHNEPSSSRTSDCHFIVDEASVFDNVNTEYERDKNKFENAMHKNSHVKQEISNGDRETSIGIDDLPNIPPRGGVKSEIYNNRKKTKVYIGNKNKSIVNEIQNKNVGSILLLQNLSSEFSSMTSSSGIGSCNLMDETSVLDVNSKYLENKGIYEILGLKNNHIKEKITNEDNTKPLESDTISNMLQKWDLKVEENTEVNIKRKKTEHDCSNEDENILQELHLHLDKQKTIVDMLRNITMDINVRLLQKSFTEMCNSQNYNSRCHTGVFSHGNSANNADGNINSCESILKNELTEKYTISSNVVDKAVVIKKETINEKEDEISKRPKTPCSMLGKI